MDRTPIDSIKTTRVAADAPLEPLAKRMPQVPSLSLEAPKVSTKKFTQAEVQARADAPPPCHVDLDFKEFLMTNCDGKIHGSPFAGSLPCVWAGKLKEYISKYKEWDPTLAPALVRLLTRLLDGIEEVKPYFIDNEQQIAQLAAEQKAKIDALQPGDSMAIPGGYILNGDGHAMVYLIQRNQDGTYNFHLINSGDGISLHGETVSGTKEKNPSCFTFKNVQGVDLSIPFFEALFQMNSKLANDAFSYDTIYKLCLVHLKKDPYRNFMLEDLITAQRSGSCSLRAQLAMIRKVIGVESYKKLIFFMGLDSVNGALTTKYDDMLQGTGPAKAMQREYASYAATNLMHMAQKRISSSGRLEYYEDALLSAQALTRKISAFEHDAKAEHVGAVREECPSVNTTLACRTNPIPPIEEWESHRTPPTYRAMPSSSDTPTSAESYFSPQFFETLEKNFTAYRGKSSPIRVYIEEVVLALPPIGTHNFSDFWKPTSREEGERVLLGLNKLITYYTNNLPRGGYLTARARNTFHSLFIFTHAICRHLEPDMAKVFGLGGILQEESADQAFFSEFEFERHNKILRYRNDHLAAVCSTEWKFPLQKFNGTELDGPLRYFYEEIYLKEIGVVQSTVSNDQSFGFDRMTRDVNPHGYDFAYAYVRYQCDKSNKLCLSVPFRALQSAQMAILTAERPGSYTAAMRIEAQDNLGMLKIACHGLTDIKRPQLSALAPDSHSEAFSIRRSRNPIIPKVFPEICEKDRNAIDRRLRRETLLQICVRHAFVSEPLAVVSLIAYGKRFFSDLETPKSRTQFELQLMRAPFDPYSSPKLYERFTDPHAARELVNFLEGQSLSLSRNIDNTNIDLALFLTRISIQVLSILPKDDPSTNRLANQLKQFAKTSLGSIPVTQLSTLSQAKFYLHNILFQSVLLGRGEAEPLEVIDAWLLYLHNPINDFAFLNELDYLQNLVEQRILPAIPSLCRPKGDDSDTVIEDLSKKLFGRPCDKYIISGMNIAMFIEDGAVDEDESEMAEKTPKLPNPEHRAYVCLLTGDLQPYGSSSKTPFPLRDLYRSSDFRTIFDHERDDFKSSFGPAYMIINDRSGQYRVAFSQNRRQLFIIEKEIEPDKWARYVSKSDVLSSYNVKITDGEREGKIPLGIACRHHAWLSENALFFTCADSGTILYREISEVSEVSNAAGASGAGREEIEDEEEDEVEYKLVSANGEPVKCSSMDSLVGIIEEPLLTHIEVNDDGFPRLCFPRFASLAFLQIAGKWCLESEQTLFLAFNKRLEDLGHFDQYLLLQNKDGDKYALIPDHRFQKEKDGTQVLDIEQIKPFSPGGNSAAPEVKFGSLQFHVIPIVDGILTPQSKEQDIACATVHFGTRNYLASLWHLNQIHNIDMRNSTRVLEGFKKFVAFAIENSEAPEGLAIAMRGLYTLAKQGLTIGGLLHTTYDNYINRLGDIPNVAGYRLTCQEELWIISIAGQEIITLSMINRRQLLKSGQVPIDSLVLSFPVTANDMSIACCKTIPFPYKKDGIYPLRDLGDITLLGLKNALTRAVETFGSLYTTCMAAKRDSDRKSKLSRALITIMTLYPREMTNAAFLYQVLHSTNHTKALGQPTFSQSRYSWEGEVSSDEEREKWTKGVAKAHGFKLTDPIVIKIPQPPETSVDLGENSSEHGLAITPFTRARNPKITLKDRIEVDMAQVPSSGYFETLAGVKERLTQASSITPRYRKEENHFQDLSALEIEKEEKTKWSAAEGNARRKFVEAYQKTVAKRASQRVICMTQADLEAEMATISATYSDQVAELDEIEKRLLELANYCPSERVLEGDVLQVGHLAKPVEIVDLLYLFFSGQVEGYKLANPHLTEEQIPEITHLAATYFKWSIELTQIGNIHDKLREIHNELSSEGLSSTREVFSSEGVPQFPTLYDLLQKLRELVSQTSEYDLKAQPERVVFEYAMQIMLRKEPDQAEALRFLLDKILAGENGVAHVRMGGGKTSVFMVYILAKMALGKDAIPVLMTPAFQLKALENVIRDKLKRVFNVDLLVIEHTREELTLKRLSQLLADLEEIQMGPEHLTPKVAMLCPVTLQLLSSEFISTMQEVADTDDLNPIGSAESNELGILEAKLKVLAEILYKFANHSLILCDEVHRALNVLFELNIPRGAKRKTPQDEVALVMQVGRILNRPEFREKLSLHVNRQSKHFNKKKFKEEILPNLALELAKYKELFLDDETMRGYLARYISGDMNPRAEELLIKHQVNEVPPDEISEHGPQLAEDFEFMQYLYKLRASEDTQEREAAKRIALSKYILSSLLPFALENKTCRVGFGRVEREGMPGKVGPWSGPKCPTSNEFGSENEFLLFTVLTTVIFGVEDSQIRARFEKYKEDAAFATEKLGMDYEATFAVKTCRAEYKIAPHELEEHFDSVRELVKRTPALMFDIEEVVSGDYAESAPERLPADANTTVSLCKRFLGVSGTPNKGLLPHSLQTNTKEDTTVNTDVIHVILSKEEEITFVSEDSPEAMISSALQDEETFGILDIGSVCQDIENVDVAKEILAKTSQEKTVGVVFFTKHNGSLTADFPAVLLRGAKEPEILRSLEPEELAKWGLNENNYKLYLDHSHCEGIDVIAKNDAQFAVFWGANITLNEGTQGFKRARLLENSQNVKLYMTEAESALFPVVRGTPFISLPLKEQLKQIVRQMLKMQSRETARRKTKSFRKMACSPIVQALRDQGVDLCRTGHTLSAIQSFMKKAHSFFYIEEERDHFVLCGSLEKEVPTVATLEKEFKEHLRKFKTLLSKVVSRTALESIEEEFEKIIKLARETAIEFETTISKPISQLLSIEDGRGAQVECQVVQEVVESTVEREVEKEVENELLEMQGKLPLTDKAHPPFYADKFIAHHLGEFVSTSDLASMREVFSDKYSAISYRAPYGNLFSDKLYVSTEALSPYTRRLSMFDQKVPRAEYMLLIKDPSGNDFKGVVVSRRQAEELKKSLAKTHQDGVWLVHPTGEMEAGNVEVFPREDEIVLDMMLQFGLLSGNLDLCFENLTLYYEWFKESPPETQILIKRFVEMQYLKNKPLFKHFHLILTDLDELEKLVFKENEVGYQQAGESAEPEEIKTWSDKHTKLIPYLVRPEQVAALPEALYKHLKYNQMKLVPSINIHLIQSVRCIKAIPEEVLKDVKVSDLPPSFFRQLSPRQVGMIEDVAMFDYLTKEKWKHISPNVMGQRDFDEADFRLFSELQLVNMKDGAVDKMLIFNSTTQKYLKHTKDPKVLMTLLKRGKNLPTEGHYAYLDDPECFPLLTKSSHYNKLKLELRKEIACSTKYVPQLQAFSTSSREFEEIVHHGFREFSPQQISRLTKSGIIRQVKKEDAEHVDVYFCNQLLAEQFSDKAIEKFVRSIKLNLIIDFTVEQLKVYLEHKQSPADTLTSWRTRDNLSFQVRLLRAGYKETEPQVIRKFTTEEQIELLSDDQLMQLSRSQIETVLRKESLIVRLKAPKFNFVDKSCAKYIPASSIDTTIIRKYADDLTEEQVSQFDESQLETYMTNCNRTARFDQICDLQKLRCILKLGYEGFSDAQEAILFPKLSLEEIMQLSNDSLTYYIVCETRNKTECDKIVDRSKLLFLEHNGYSHFTEEQLRILHPEQFREPSPVAKSPPLSPLPVDQPPSPDSSKWESVVTPPILDAEKEESEFTWEGGRPLYTSTPNGSRSPQSRRSSSDLSDRFFTEEQHRRRSPPREEFRELVQPTYHPDRFSMEEDDDWKVPSATPSPPRTPPSQTQPPAKPYTSYRPPQPTVYSNSTRPEQPSLRTTRQDSQWERDSRQDQWEMEDEWPPRGEPKRNPKPTKVPQEKVTAAIKDPKEIAEVGPDQASYVNPKLAKHLSKEAITGIKDKRVFQALNTSQMRHMRTEQLQMASYMQVIAYTIMTFVDTIISIALIIPVEIGYLLTRLCCLKILQGAHEYTTGSIVRMLALNWYFVRRVVLCGMCFSGNNEAAKS